MTEHRNHDRDHDIVLFGATGFTGELTAAYLARHAPAGTRWALAGRDRGRLEQVRATLALINPACESLPILHADVTDRASITTLARSTRLVITTVGPYIVYGEAMVAACAENGTDYVDLTGEPEFVDRMYVGYHEVAKSTGARLVHACGFDSIPHDLGAYFTVQQLPEGVPLHVEGFIRVKGDASGGTASTFITALARGRQMAQAARLRRGAEPATDSSRRSAARRGLPRFASPDGGRAVPFPAVDQQIVVRSGRALERYGPDFSYGHYFVVKRAATAIGLVAGLSAVAALAQLPPTRALLLRWRKPGAGPDEAARAGHWFSVKFVGEGGGQRVVTEVAGGDPGYGETAKMLAESALCLLHDDLPPTAGQVTTASALGDALITRLVDAGITFRVVAGAG